MTFSALIGSWGGILLMLGIGLAAMPNAGHEVCVPMIFGSAILGGIFGQIAGRT